MKQLILGLLACMTWPLSAVAAPCRDTIAAMYDGGPLDPRHRPPHRQVNTVTGEDGTVIRIFDTVMESATRSKSGIRGGSLFAMIIDNRSWTGPTLDGPWTEAPNQLPINRAAQLEQVRQQQIKNLSETSCPGMVDVAGRTYKNVQFTTRTDPNPDMNNAWFGTTNSVFIDPDARRVMRWEQTNHVNSWQEGTGTDRHVLVFDYDTTIQLEVPD